MMKVKKYQAADMKNAVAQIVGELGKDAPINEGFPVTFLGHAKFIFAGPVIILSLVIGTILAIAFLPKQHRRFLLCWIVLLLVFYLNPLAASILIEHISDRYRSFC